MESIRRQFAERCSVGWAPELATVVELIRDDSDLLVLTGTLGGSPFTNVFVRYGNTVTYAQSMLLPLNAADVKRGVDDALAN